MWLHLLQQSEQGRDVIDVQFGQQFNNLFWFNLHYVSNNLQNMMLLFVSDEESTHSEKGNHTFRTSPLVLPIKG